MFGKSTLSPEFIYALKIFHIAPCEPFVITTLFSVRLSGFSSLNSLITALRRFSSPMFAVYPAFPSTNALLPALRRELGSKSGSCPIPRFIVFFFAKAFILRISEISIPSYLPAVFISATRRHSKFRFCEKRRINF